MVEGIPFTWRMHGLPSSDWSRPDWRGVDDGSALHGHGHDAGVGENESAVSIGQYDAGPMRRGPCRRRDDARGDERGVCPGSRRHLPSSRD